MCRKNAGGCHHPAQDRSHEVEISVAQGISPDLTINLTETTDGDVEMEPYPKIVTEESREAAGVVRNHTMEITVCGGFATVQAAADNLAYNDIVAVLTTYDGTRFAVLPFANSSVLAFSDSRQQTHTQMLKYLAQSYSGLARVSQWNVVSN